jgi:hypothetical protein
MKQVAAIKTLTVDTHRQAVQDVEQVSPSVNVQTQMKEQPDELINRLASQFRNYGGEVDIAVTDLPEGQKKHCLMYTRDSDWPATYPVSSETEFCLEYDSLLKTWKATGRLFGLLVNDDMPPEALLHSLQNRGHTKMAPKQAFFNFAIKYAERYTGDHRLMLYKLGIELVAIGTMVLSTGPDEKIIATWVSGSDPGFCVYFSVEQTPISERLLFGFFPEPATHTFLADPAGFLGVVQLTEEYQLRLKQFTVQCFLPAAE